MTLAVLPTPQRGNTLGGSGSAEALDDAIVLAVETTGLQHLILDGVSMSLGEGLRGGEGDRGWERGEGG